MVLTVKFYLKVVSTIQKLNQTHKLSVLQVTIVLMLLKNPLSVQLELILLRVQFAPLILNA